MKPKKSTPLLGDLFAGNILVKFLKTNASICIFVGFIFAVAVFVTSRNDFGYRGLLAYAGIAFIFGIVVFELAEVIRWLQKVYERFDLYDKIDQ